jgi:hypothetical protein
MTVIEATPEKQPAGRPPLTETWSQNEPMRHVPSIDWIVRKLDGDVRRRIDILWPPVAALASADPRFPAVEQEFRALCRALDQLADTAKHIRNTHAPHDLGSHIPWALNHAASCLRTVDAQTFGRRFPVQTHERSKAEPLYAALLVVLRHVERATELVREIDGGVDERLLDGLVKLEPPVDDRMRTPIA